MSDYSSRRAMAGGAACDQARLVQDCGASVGELYLAAIRDRVEQAQE